MISELGLLGSRCFPHREAGQKGEAQEIEDGPALISFLICNPIKIIITEGLAMLALNRSGISFVNCFFHFAEWHPLE